MGTEVKCNVKVCKFQCNDLCTREDIEIMGDEPDAPDMALCQTLTILPQHKYKAGKVKY